MTSEIGGRREALLVGWKSLVSDRPAGEEFDFTDTNRTVQTQQHVHDFLQSPDRETFNQLWTIDVLADAVIGGPEPVIKKHGSVEELAKKIREMSHTDEYDPNWESDFLTSSVVRELYGRLHPEEAPIINSTCKSGLSEFGFSVPTTYSEFESVWFDFAEIYDELVGHGTAGLPHEVPLNHEMSEFLWFIAAMDDEEIQDRYKEVHDEYLPILGWKDDLPLSQDIHLKGHEEHIQGYIEAAENGGFQKNPPKDLWNKGHWEDWKDGYLMHLKTEVWPAYDFTELSQDEVVQLIDDLNVRIEISNSIPTYLLGGRSGGILWSEFRQRSEENPQQAAETLSYLFDEEELLTHRLDRFGQFYGVLDTSGGPLMSLATMLLMFVHPDEYVLYKHSQMRGFFDRYADYRVRPRFNPDQYWKLNLACKNQILKELETGLDEKSATMLDVYTFLYVWNSKYSD